MQRAPGDLPAPSRRRGKKLESAIIEAVWEELRETGYAGFTIAGVAARARTSTPVLYRRWPTRGRLVAAAAFATAPRSEDAPDTGELRSDLVALLRQSARRLEVLPADAFPGLLADAQNDPELAGTLRSGLIDQGDRVPPIVERAVERGEIPPGRRSPRVMRLPLDLIRHDYVIYGSPITDDAIAQMVDRVILPALRTDRD